MMRPAAILLALGACWHGPPPPEPPAAPPVARPRPPVEPDAPCRGSHLEIARVQEQCAGGTGAQSIPPAIDIGLDVNPVTIDGGTTRELALVLRNTASEDVEVVLDDSCGAAAEVNTMILDRRGKRIDTTGPQCGSGRGCGSQSIAFTLRPAGSLRIPFVVDGRMLTYDSQCNEQRVGAVPAGQYTLSIASSVKDLDVPITVY